jgi:hypothetical protein
LIITEVLTGPDAGLRLAIVGAVEVMVKPTTLLGTPATVTTTPPVIPPFGTFTKMLV